MADASQLPGVVQSYHLLNQYREQSKGELVNNLSGAYTPNFDVFSAANSFSPYTPFQNSLNFALNNSSIYDPIGCTSVNISDDLLGAFGDPHYNFTDKTGKSVTIDHKGTDGQTYNLLNADGLDIDAEYKHCEGDENPENKQVIGALRINNGNQELILNEGKVVLNGQELQIGEKRTLADGRTIEVLENGGLKISTKDGKGAINIKNNDNFCYDVDPTGQLNIDTGKDNGGILGFLTALGKNKSKDEILAQYDTNQNGILDDGDKNLALGFSAGRDIGFYESEAATTSEGADAAATTTATEAEEPTDPYEKAKQWAMSAEDNMDNIYTVNPEYEFSL